MSDKEICEIFSKNLKRLMEQNGMAQIDLVKKCGAAASSVNYWVKGKNIPRTPMLRKLTEIFGCKLSDLTTDINASQNTPTAPTVRVSPERQELLDMVDSLTDEEVTRLLQIARLVTGG